MIYVQILINGLALGGLYACIAVGFSLVWGVLNVINLVHGSMIVLGSYIALFCYQALGIHPFLAVPIAGFGVFSVTYCLQKVLINRVIAAPVLMTLTLTFGLDLIFNNLMIAFFKADYRKLNLQNPLGSIEYFGVTLPVDRIAAMCLAILLTYFLFRLLKDSKIGRAIVAVRMDRDAATLMGVNVMEINAITFGIGGFMAGAAGCLLSMIFPISPLNNTLFLGKSFVVCVLGGLGSVPGAIVGGLTLGVIESFGAFALGPEHSVTLAFSLLIIFLVARPTGLMGKKGFE